LQHVRLLLLNLLCTNSRPRSITRWQLILVLVRPMFRRVAHSIPAMLPLRLLLQPSQSMGNWKTAPGTDFQPCQSIITDLFKTCQGAPFCKIVIKKLYGIRDQLSWKRDETDESNKAEVDG
jgi:hypothetical protein